mgnify:CR=1 FL=1
MSKDWYISHPQDRMDIISDLDDIKFPYRLMLVSQRARDGTESDKWKRLNAFLHRGVIPTYSSLSGLMEDEAKSDLQIRFALVRDNPSYYDVESVSGMSVKRLIKFIDDIQMFLAINFGTKADELLTENSIKYLKTKKIKKWK